MTVQAVGSKLPEAEIKTNWISPVDGAVHLTLSGKYDLRYININRVASDPSLPPSGEEVTDLVLMPRD